MLRAAGRSGRRQKKEERRSGSGSRGAGSSRGRGGEESEDLHGPTLAAGPGAPPTFFDKVAVVSERTTIESDGPGGTLAGPVPGPGPDSGPGQFHDGGADGRAACLAHDRADARADDGGKPRVVRPRGWAKTVTDVLSPAHFVIALPPFIGWHATTPSRSGLAWGLFCSVLAGGVPYGFVIHAVLRRKVSDLHIRTRQERYIPILVALGAMGLCVALLALGSAPRALIALLASLLATIGVGGVITLRWQISGHAAAAAGSVGICALCFGPWVLAFSPLVVLICAARLVLRDHTAGQLAAGVALGGVLSTLVMSALR
jgi:hypothetical protein